MMEDAMRGADVDFGVLREKLELTLQRRAQQGLDARGRAAKPAPDTRGHTQSAGADVAALLRSGVAPRAFEPHPRRHEEDPPSDRHPLPFVIAGDFACESGCGRHLEYPGRCEHCEGLLRRREHRERVRQTVIERLPKIHWNCRWDRVCRLVNQHNEPRVRASEEYVARIRHELNRPRLHTVLFGPLGAGKSTLAACWAHEQIDAGRDVRFICTTDLDESDDGRLLYRQALTVPELVLDDLTGELLGATPAQSAARIARVVRVVRTRVAADRRTVFTVARPQQQVLGLYGGDVGRRLYVGALEIPVGCSADWMPESNGG